MNIIKKMTMEREIVYFKNGKFSLRPQVGYESHVPGKRRVFDILLSFVEKQIALSHIICKADSRSFCIII